MFILPASRIFSFCSLFLFGLLFGQLKTQIFVRYVCGILKWLYKFLHITLSLLQTLCITYCNLQEITCEIWKDEGGEKMGTYISGRELGKLWNSFFTLLKTSYSSSFCITLWNPCLLWSFISYQKLIHFWFNRKWQTLCI